MEDRLSVLRQKGLGTSAWWSVCLIKANPGLATLVNLNVKLQGIGWNTSWAIIFVQLWQAGAILCIEKTGSARPVSATEAWKETPNVHSPRENHRFSGRGEWSQTACLSTCVSACHCWRHLGILNLEEEEFTQVTKAVLYKQKVKFTLLLFCSMLHGESEATERERNIPKVNMHRRDWN